jgi:hypothetical protein
MRRVEQRGVLGVRRLDVGPGRVGVAQLQRNADNLEPRRMKLTAQRLPPGQVEGAASIGRPGDENDFLTA